MAGHGSPCVENKRPAIPPESAAELDLFERGMEGLELIRRLHLNVPDLPIIAICSDIQGVLADSLRALGVVSRASSTSCATLGAA